MILDWHRICYLCRTILWYYLLIQQREKRKVIRRLHFSGAPYRNGKCKLWKSNLVLPLQPCLAPRINVISNSESGTKRDFCCLLTLYPSRSPFLLSIVGYLQPSFLSTCLQSGISNESRAIFYLDAPSASVCLLIQLEKPATEEGGITSSVYSRKEPVCIPFISSFVFLIWLGQ